MGHCATPEQFTMRRFPAEARGDEGPGVGSRMTAIDRAYYSMRPLFCQSLDCGRHHTVIRPSLTPTPSGG
ncbi:MAG TPA: hypothetical protein VIC27_08605 [Ktedonobacterales bacterium]